MSIYWHKGPFAIVSCVRVNMRCFYTWSDVSDGTLWAKKGRTNQPTNKQYTIGTKTTPSNWCHFAKCGKNICELCRSEIKITIKLVIMIFVSVHLAQGEMTFYIYVIFVLCFTKTDNYPSAIYIYWIASIEQCHENRNRCEITLGQTF